MVLNSEAGFTFSARELWAFYPPRRKALKPASWRTPNCSCGAASWLISSHVKYISVSLQVCWGGHSGPSIINPKPVSIINAAAAGGGGVVNGVETVHYPSARSLLSICVRMSSAGNLLFLLWCLQEKHRTMRVCGQELASPGNFCSTRDNSAAGQEYERNFI